MIASFLGLLYGVGAYVVFLATFLYAIGFVGNLGVPRGIDSPASGSLLTSLGIDLLLLTVFAVQHSVMARPAFKRMWTRIVSPSVERSTFVLAASLALALLFWQWRPLGGVLWDVQAAWARMALYGLFACGWAIVLLSTLLIDHLELFGLRQVWTAWRGHAAKPARFVTPAFYRIVRHPLYLGFLIAFWATPTMTVTHLVFALATTGYILIAIQLEERDLLAAHPEYAEYRRHVPMIVPGLGGDAATLPTSASSRPNLQTR